MGCEGNPTEACGGPALLNLYNFTGTYPIGASVVPTVGEWNSLGCYRYVPAFTTISKYALIASKVTRCPRVRLSAVLTQEARPWNRA